MQVVYGSTKNPEKPIGPYLLNLDGKPIDLTQTVVMPDTAIYDKVCEALSYDLKKFNLSMQLSTDWIRVATFVSKNFKIIGGYRSDDRKYGYKSTYYVYTPEIIRDSATVGCVTLVDNITGSIVGCAAVGKATISVAGELQNVAKVNYISVQVDRRGQGLASTLISGITKLVMDKNITSVYYVTTEQSLIDKAIDTAEVNAIILRPEVFRPVVKCNPARFTKNINWRLAKPVDLPLIKEYLGTAIKNHIYEVITPENEHLFVNHSDFRFTLIKPYVDPDTGKKSVIGLVRCYVQEQIYELLEDTWRGRKSADDNLEIKVANMDYLYLPNPNAFNEVASYCIERGIHMATFLGNKELAGKFQLLMLYMQGFVLLNTKSYTNPQEVQLEPDDSVDL